MRALHQFIKNLDSNEKKYFRRFGFRDVSKGESQAKVLFELLEETEEYNEEKTENRIRRLKLDKNLVHTKNYLFDLLTETLAWYHRERFSALSSSFTLAQVLLLEEKGLVEYASKLFSKLSKESLAYGSFTEKWQTLHNSIHAASNDFLSNKKNDLAATKEYLKQREKLLTDMQLYHEYDSLLVEQLNIIRKAMQARNAKDLKMLKDIFENKLVQNVSFATSADALFTFHTIRIQHFNILGKYAELLIEAEQLIDFYKKNSSSGFSLMRILWAYSQWAQASYFNNDWQKLETCLKELSEVKTQSRIEAIAKFSYYTQMAIPLFDYRKDTAAMKKLLVDTKQKLKEFKTDLRVDIRLAICITCASALVEYKEYENAIDVCEDFLTNYDTGIRLDALLMLYAYEFISHLELGNTVYLNNIMQNVRRYFVRNDYKGNFENTLLKTFKKLSETGNMMYSKKEIEALKAELEKSASDVSNPQNLALLPVIQSYLESKQMQRSTCQ